MPTPIKPRPTHKCRERTDNVPNVIQEPSGSPENMKDKIENLKDMIETLQKEKQ